MLTHSGNPERQLSRLGESYDNRDKNVERSKQVFQLKFFDLGWSRKIVSITFAKKLFECLTVCVETAINSRTGIVSWILTVVSSVCVPAISWLVIPIVRHSGCSCSLDSRGS